MGCYLHERGVALSRATPYHPRTQCKLERYDRPKKNVAMLQHSLFTERLAATKRTFLAYHDDDTPADAYPGQ